MNVETNIEEFNRVFARYADVYDPKGWFRADILAKKGAAIGFAWQKRLDQGKPIKGTIRAERIAAMKAGEGTKVRESILRRLKLDIEEVRKTPAGTKVKSTVLRRLGGFKNVRSLSGAGQRLSGKLEKKSGKNTAKRLNFQALAVRNELNLRERGIGFQRYSSRIRGLASFAVAREKMVADRKWKEMGRYSQLLAEAGLDFDGLTLTYGSPRSESGEALQTPAAKEALAIAIREVTQDMEVYLARKAEEAAKGAGFK